MNKRVSFLKLFSSVALLSLIIGCAEKPVADRGATLGTTQPDPAKSAGDDAASLTDLQNQAVAMMGQFEYDKAVGKYEQLLITNTDEERYQVDLAIALLNRRAEGDLNRSSKMLDAIIEASPENLRAKYCRALLHFNDGATEKSQQLFEQVAQSDPRDSYAVYYVGQTQLMRKEFAKALDQFKLAQELDPYLRSAYYGAFQAAQRLKDSKQARQYLESFQRLENNPRSRLAELKYTRMGPKAAVSKPPSETSTIEQPAGPMFAEATSLALTDDSTIPWSRATPSAPSITTADINGDGTNDLFIAGGLQGANDDSGNLVLLGGDEGYRRDSSCELENVSNVNTALWGDFDNDGLSDVYLCRNGNNQLWRQSSPGQWQNVTEETQSATGDSNTLDGACYDADHDGDLDYFLVHEDAPVELLNNDRDGTFRPLADEMEIATSGRKAKQVVIADLDVDDDADVIVLNEEQPHEIYSNDRLWRYHPSEGFEDFAKAAVAACVAADADVDGQVELYTFGSNQLLRWKPNSLGKWLSEPIAQIEAADNSLTTLNAQDFDGDSDLEIALQVGSEVYVYELDGQQSTSLSDDSLIGPVATLINPNGPELIGARSEKTPVIWKAGSGRFDYAFVHLSGQFDKAAEMRSNASGIGVRGAARIGTRWATVSPWRTGSGPGQSLQAHAIGLAGANKIDFLQLVWPDGVSQTEIDLSAETKHRIAETQRQAGSCPLVFVWNGEEFEFIADMLGAGGIGFNLGRGEYYPPRPTEKLLIPADRIVAKDGRIVMKLGEPMEEICYFDVVRLETFDVPPGWQMALDERFGGTDPQPTGEPVYYTKQHIPTHAVNDRDQDVTVAIASTDQKASPLARSDRRFVGMTNPHEVTLTFEQPINDLKNPVLVFDGWVEYAYSQTAFAAWQAGLTYTEPTVEAQGSDGQWKIVLDRFGYMAGTSRRSSVKIPRDKLPPGTTRLRISSNMQIYWDQISIVDAHEVETVAQQQLPLLAAEVAEVGFSTRVIHDQRRTIYDYQNRPPFGGARHPSGFYTALGDAKELVDQTDDAVAIIGPGEELHMEFAEPQSPPRDGWSRYYVLQADGWCKDSDSFTKDSRQVEPLPTRGSAVSSQEARHRENLHSKYNTRFRSGW